MTPAPVSSLQTNIHHRTVSKICCIGAGYVGMLVDLEILLLTPYMIYSFFLSLILTYLFSLYLQ